MSEGGGAIRPGTDGWEPRYGSRLLDGPQVWGVVEAGSDRRGFRRYRLLLFPPGITRCERALLRLWRALPTGGAALWLLAIICLSQVHSPWEALGLATAGYVSIGLLTWGRLGATRTQVRTLTAVIIAGYSQPGAAQTYAELKHLATVLWAADALLEQGRISPTEHECVWWQAYERIGTRCETTDLETG